MLTRCPHCRTIYRITAAQLEAANGQVRCGRCDTLFDAHWSLLPDIAVERESRPTPGAAAGPEALDDRETAAERAGETIRADGDGPGAEAPAAAPDASPAAAAGGAEPGAQAPTPAPDLATPSGEVAPEVPESAPGEARHDEPAAPATGHAAAARPGPAPAVGGVEASPSPDEEVPVLDAAADLVAAELGQQLVIPRQRRTWPWALGSLLLTGGLALQVLYLRPSWVNEVPALLPLATRICALAGCRIPPRADPATLVLLSRDVRIDPRQPDALLVQLSFANTARHPQPYPLIELKLSGSRGQNVGHRRFAPREYLPAGPDLDRAIEEGMEPGEMVTVQLRLRRPREEPASYEFRLVVPG